MHRTVIRLSCYMNIPKYSKLFIQIVRKCLSGKRLVREIIDESGHADVREISFRKTSCPGKWLVGIGLVRDTSCPGNVCPGKWLSGKRALPEFIDSMCKSNVQNCKASRPPTTQTPLPSHMDHFVTSRMQQSAAEAAAKQRYNRGTSSEKSRQNKFYNTSA